MSDICLKPGLTAAQQGGNKMRGRVAEFYMRLSPKATNYTAVTAPTFVAHHY